MKDPVFERINDVEMQFRMREYREIINRALKDTGEMRAAAEHAAKTLDEALQLVSKQDSDFVFYVISVAELVGSMRGDEPCQPDWIDVEEAQRITSYSRGHLSKLGNQERYPVRMKTEHGRCYFDRASLVAYHQNSLLLRRKEDDSGLRFQF